MTRQQISLSAERAGGIGRTAPPSFLFRPVRTRILAELESGAGLTHKVLSIVAPVGYGKTVTMAELFSHLTEQGELCFWIALDERDASVARVLQLIEELARGPEVALHPTQALFRGDESPEMRVEALLELATNISRPFTLFIDNLNCCTDEALGPLLDSLVFRTSPAIRFVFSSTAELPLNLTRAKLEGLVRQISYSELSLDADQTGELLGPRLAAQIGSEGVDAVLRRTEGWPAAARMAQIVLASAENPADALNRFSGSDEDVAALLNRQVLSGFPPEVREFLLCISPLRTFSVDLCRHATGSALAERHLALLLRRNVFVIPLDRNRTWYRLHGLFREFLLDECARVLDPQVRRDVLVRAAEWCEQGGQWHDAIDYALAADAVDIVSRILESTATTFVRDRGDMRQYIEWVEALHGRGRRPGWEAEYWYLWALAFHRRYEYGRRQCEQLAARIRADMQAGGDPVRLGELQRRVDIVKISIDIFTDRPADAGRNATQWLSGAHADDPFNVAAASGSESIHYSSAFMFADARRSAQVAKTAAFQAGSAYATGWIAALSGLIPVCEGSYADARDELASALAIARRDLGDGTGICGTIALIAAKPAIEMGLDAEARELLTFGMRTSQVHGFVDAAACGLDAAAKLWRGKDDDVVGIQRLREIAGSYPPRLSFMLTCYLARRLLRLGRLDEALDEASRIGLRDAEPPTVLPSSAGVARGREAYFALAIELSIAQGRFRQAESLIAEEARHATQDGRPARLVDLALNETAIAMQANKVNVAGRHLSRAIRLATRRRVIRPFRDLADTIAALVENAKPSAWGFALAEERSFFAEICQMAPMADPLLQDRLVALNTSSPLIEGLTARQTELLALLDAGLSNQQMADHIDVSLTTIKWHLQQLYGKLGVASRAAALARARALNLLAR